MGRVRNGTGTTPPEPEKGSLFRCPRGHVHREGAAFCTVCGAGPVLAAPLTATERLRDSFRDPRGWLLMALPWPIRRWFFARRLGVGYGEVPSGARYLGMRKVDLATIRRGQDLAEKHGW